MKYFAFFIAAFFLYSAPLQAQLGKTKAATRHVKQAEVLVNKGQLDEARRELEAAIKAKPDFVSAQRMLGMLYSRLHQYDEAVAAYEKTFELQPDLSRAAYYECALAYLRLSKYSAAKRYFVLYQNANPADYKTEESMLNLAYAKELPLQLANCAFALAENQNILLPEAENLGRQINSSADEYLPTLSNDGRLLIFTRKRQHEDILSSERKNGDWTAAQSFGKAINGPLNEGMANLTACGRTIYFAGCQRADGRGGCDIFKAQFENGEISNIHLTEGPLNTADWESQPSISCDGTLLFFSSNREGGEGGTDIWVSRLQKDGKWGAPENLGPHINTPYDEEAPFIAADGQTLYFASNGHPGFGEADIFRTVLEGNTWSVPQNLGRAVNTPFREAGFAVTADASWGYFASGRPGGKGGIDLYRAPMHREIVPEVPNVMVHAVVVSNLEDKPLAHAKVKVGQSGKTLQQLQADAQGRFFLCLPDGGSYSFIIEAENHETMIHADYYKRKEGEFVKEVELKMQANAALVEAYQRERSNLPSEQELSFYFPTGEYELNIQQRQRLEQALVKLGNQPELLEVEIMGFADKTGNAAANQALSEKRAAAVAAYFEQLRVPQNAIQYSGEGEAKEGEEERKRRVEIRVKRRISG